jgi:hypothetical protein
MERVFMNDELEKMQKEFILKETYCEIVFWGDSGDERKSENSVSKNRNNVSQTMEWKKLSS